MRNKKAKALKRLAVKLAGNNPDTKSKIGGTEKWDEGSKTQIYKQLKKVK